jgi:hypothetical protein
MFADVMGVEDRPLAELPPAAGRAAGMMVLVAFALPICSVDVAHQPERLSGER